MICSQLLVFLSLMAVGLSEVVILPNKEPVYFVDHKEHMRHVNREQTESLGDKDDTIALAKLRSLLEPLPVQDVACLSLVKGDCSEPMARIKRTLVQAIQDDCSHCREEDKKAAGVAAAKMMLYNYAAWKMFITRTKSAEDGVMKKLVKEAEMVEESERVFSKENLVLRQTDYDEKTKISLVMEAYKAD